VAAIVTLDARRTRATLAAIDADPDVASTPTRRARRTLRVLGRTLSIQLAFETSRRLVEMKVGVAGTRLHGASMTVGIRSTKSDPDDTVFTR
jgi:broad specificity phosphatase PhoE